MRGSSTHDPGDYKTCLVYVHSPGVITCKEDLFKGGKGDDRMRREGFT